MVDFSSPVAVPPTSAYGPGIADFFALANAPNTYYQGVFNKQQQQTNDQAQQLNQQAIVRGQQQQALTRAFPNGLPTDPRTGQLDIPTITNTLAKFGDIAGAVNLMQQQPAPMSSMLGGPGSPAAAGAQPAAPVVQPQPLSIPAKPLPAPSPNSPQGDQGGSVIARVTDALPNGSDKVGLVATNLARSIGVDPNATLTPEQAQKVDDRLSAYMQRNGIKPQGGIAPSSRIDGAFNALPPSANAGTPAPRSAPAPQQPAQQPAAQGAPNGAGSPQAAGAPLVPQEPLPPGYTDPQKAIADLRREALRYSTTRQQGAREIADELKAKADRIEKSITPIPVHPGTTYLDPRTRQPVYQGNQPTLSLQAVQDAAERYLQTGQFPTGMGRGVQGNPDRNAILEEANHLANERGINAAELPQKWQQFKAQQIAIQRFGSGKEAGTIKSFNVLVDHLDTLTEVADALKNGNIRIFNKAAQNWAAATGGTAPTNFDGVKALVGDEIVKAVAGSAGALADREEVKKDLDRASSPKQLAELIDHYKKLALGQLKGLRKEFTSSTGMTEKDFDAKLLPGTVSALGGEKSAEGRPSADGWTVHTLQNGKKARVQQIPQEAP